VSLPRFTFLRLKIEFQVYRMARQSKDAGAGAAASGERRIAGAGLNAQHSSRSWECVSRLCGVRIGD